MDSSSENNVPQRVYAVLNGTQVFGVTFAEYAQIILGLIDAIQEQIPYLDGFSSLKSFYDNLSSDGGRPENGHQMFEDTSLPDGVKSVTHCHRVLQVSKWYKVPEQLVCFELYITRQGKLLCAKTILERKPTYVRYLTFMRFWVLADCKSLESALSEMQECNESSSTYLGYSICRAICKCLKDTVEERRERLAAIEKSTRYAEDVLSRIGPS